MNEHVPQPGGVAGPRLRKKAKNRSVAMSEPSKPGTRFTSKRFEKRSPLKRGGFKAPPGR